MALAAAVAAIALVALPAAAGAATLTVTTQADTSAASCTLRDAITAANTNADVPPCLGSGAYGADTIQFSVPSASTITLGSTLPHVNGDLAIAGPGTAQLAISGQDLFQVLVVDASPTVTISGLTITHGACAGLCQGAGIQNDGLLTLNGVAVTANTNVVSGGTNLFSEGGGIENHSGATLNLVLSTVSGNTVSASGASSQNGASGGGILNRGTLNIDRSAITGNQVTADAGMGATTNANGGAVNTFGAVTIARSTFSGNQAIATGAGFHGSQGGAFATANAPAAVLAIDSSTISGNTSSNSGGGINSSSPAVASITNSTITANSGIASGANLVGAHFQLANTIVSNPQVGSNCSGTVTSMGHNLEDGSLCGLNQASDLTGVPAGLNPVLADNGGPTPTHALLAGSPAIDSGDAGAATSDQRLLLRPVDLAAIPNNGGDGSDIGAFELQAPQAPPTATSVTLATSKRKVRKTKKGVPVTLTATVAPCSGRTGDSVRFLLGSVQIGAAALDSSCTARLTVRVKKRSSFKATVPADVDHLQGTSAAAAVKAVKKKRRKK